MGVQYAERTYRKIVDPEGLRAFEVKIDSTDLQIISGEYLEKEALISASEHRGCVKEYIKKYPEFAESLAPVKVDYNAPRIVKEMAYFSRRAGVGPMASVAGAISEYVGRDLLRYADEVIVENGGDIFIKTKSKRRVAIFAGDSPLSLKLSILVRPEDTPLGICASSGTVGPSLSFGRADASVVISKSCVLADAAATALGNIVKDAGCFDEAIEFAKRTEGVKGAILIVGDKMAVWGDVTLT